MTIDDLKNLPDDFLTVETVAEYLGCNPQNLRTAIRDTNNSGIPAICIGSRIRIPKNAFIDAMNFYRR